MRFTFFSIVCLVLTTRNFCGASVSLVEVGPTFIRGTVTAEQKFAKSLPADGELDGAARGTVGGTPNAELDISVASSINVDVNETQASFSLNASGRLENLSGSFNGGTTGKFGVARVRTGSTRYFIPKDTTVSLRYTLSGSRSVLNELLSENPDAEAGNNINFTGSGLQDLRILDRFAFVPAATFDQSGFVVSQATSSGTLSVRPDMSVNVTRARAEEGQVHFVNTSMSMTLLIGPGAAPSDPLLPSDAPPISPPTQPSLNNLGNPETPDGNAIDFAGTDPFVFEEVESGRWYDPIAASGFAYQMEGVSLFTRIIDFADGFDSDFRVWANGQSLGIFSEDDEVDFVELLGEGVEAFAVTGISPLLDGEDPFAFPIQLDFDTENASFSQWALAVPEPSSGLLLLVGLTPLLARRRHAHRSVHGGWGRAADR